VDVEALVFVFLDHLRDQLRFGHHDGTLGAGDIFHRLCHPRFAGASVCPDTNSFSTRSKSLYNRFDRFPLGGFQTDLFQFSGKIFFILSDFMEGFILASQLPEKNGGELGIQLDVIKA
jgi:hypothetical protein